MSTASVLPYFGLANVLGSSGNQKLPPEPYYANWTYPDYPYPSQAQVPPPGNYSVSIAGHYYTADTSFEPYRREAYRHRSIPAQRDSLNFDNSSGENVVNTAGLWRRSGQNWILGSGQKFFDWKKATPDRFYTSKGINPWTEFQITLLNDTTNSGSLGYTASGTMVDVMTAGAYTYYLESNVLKFCSSPGGALTTVTGLPTATGTVAYTSICHNGSYWFVACQTGGIYYGALGATAATGKWVSSTTTASVTGATYGSSAITYTTSAAHNFSIGEAINVTGLSNTAWNVNNATITAITSTTFTVAGSNPGGSSGSGGTATPVDFVAGYGLVAWVNDRLWAGGGASTANYSGPYLCAFSSSHVAGTQAGDDDLVTPGIVNGILPNTVGTTGASSATLTGPTGALGPTWAWSGICGGVSQVYACGYNILGTTQSDGGVYRTAIDTSAITTNGLVQPMPSGYTYPVRALPLAAGEYPTALFGYLNFVFVGTNLGVRMCQTLNVYDPTATATGDLKSGPIIPGINQTVNLPVTGFTAYKQYVWFTWANYDGTSTGLGRMDLTNFIEDLAPAYASDLMVTGQGNLMLDWDYTQNAPLICVEGSGGGVFQQSAGIVPYGTIESGWMSWDIPETKTALFTHITAPNLNGAATASVTLQSDFQTTTNIGTFGSNTGNVLPTNTMPVPSTGVGVPGKMFNYILTITPDGNVSPAITRWQLDALPQVSSETNISAVVQLYSEAVVEGAQDYKNGYAEYVYLDQIRRTQQVVWYVEGPLSAQVVIDSLDFLPEKPRGDYIKGFHAVLVVTMKTINGFSTPAPAT